MNKLWWAFKCLFWIFFFSIVVGGIALECEKKEHCYTVELTFCDARKPITINVYQTEPPSNADIRTYNEALSSYAGYKNVCEIKILKTK